MQHFLKKYNEAYGKSFQGLTRRAQIAILQHDWPGNVRELENVISSAAITATADFIDVGDLPEQFSRPQRRNSTAQQDGWLPCRSMKFAAFTFSASLKCAAVIACAPRRPSVSAAPACTVS